MPDAARELRRAALLVVEDLGMLLPAEEVDDAQRAAPFVATASVSFGGPFEGAVEISAYGDAARAFAVNFLGDESMAGPEAQRDALGEAANVLAGRLLPRLGGARAVFRIGPPRLSVESRLLGGERARIAIGVEGGRFEVRLFLVGGAAGPKGAPA